MQLKQQTQKAAHRHRVNVLTSNVALYKPKSRDHRNLLLRLFAATGILNDEI